MGASHRRIAWVLAALATGVGVGACGSLGQGTSSAGAGQTLLTAPGQASAGGVGVVRRVDLLIAFTKSDQRERVIADLIAARDAARREGRADDQRPVVHGEPAPEGPARRAWHGLKLIFGHEAPHRATFSPRRPGKTCAAARREA